MTNNALSKITILFYLLCGSLGAQNYNSDSLVSLIKTLNEDTNKVKTINILGKLLINKHNYTEGVAYSEDALKIAIRIRDKKGEGTAIGNIGYSYFVRSENPKALEYFLKSLKIQEQINNLPAVASLYNNIGSAYRNMGDQAMALTYYEKALKIKRQIGDKRGEGVSLNNMGIVYWNQGNYPKALETHLQTLKIREEISDKQGISTSLINIGNIYNLQEDYQKALVYYMKALKISEETEDLQSTALSSMNIGGVYHKNNNFDKALVQYEKALKIKKEIDDKQGIALLQNNIGLIYVGLASASHSKEERIKQLQKALKECTLGLKIQQDIQDVDGETSSYISLGEIYRLIAAEEKNSAVRAGNFKTSKEYLTKALKLARQADFKESVRDSYKALAALDSSMGHGMQAYLNYKSYIAYRDSAFNEENTKKTVRAQMNYEFEKKEHAARLEQEKKDAIETQEKHIQAIIRNSLIGGFVLAIVLTFVMLRSYRLKKKTNIEITNQKHIIENKQKEILDSIRYARRIQTALIPSEKLIDKAITRLKENKEETI